MNIQTLREYCLGLPAVTEDTPFDETTLCFRVGGRIFAITDTDDVPLKVALKCSPERVPELRERYPAIKPGWHLNKKHWNTIVIDGSLEDGFLQELIRHSYDLIFAKLTKKAQKEILGTE